jgi:hypothetical protein
MTTCAIRVIARSNTGEESAEDATDRNDAARRAKTLRTPVNHMVWIEENGQRFLRWDRDRVKDSNHWRKVDPDDFETLGQIREVRGVR